jgi:Tol biopolymer transport system component
VLGSTQITRDGYAKVSPYSYQSLWTDGSRIYFNEEVNGAWRVAQVSAQGGETLPVPTSVSTPAVCSLDPSRSNLLIQDLISQDPVLPFWIQPLLGGTARRLGNLRGNDGVYSPDGKHIVVIQETDFYQTNLDGSETRKLASVPGVVIWPRFSPDGSLLRFTQLDLNFQNASIWEMRADGSGLQALLPDWNKPNNEVVGSWTPDGKYYIFQATRVGTANSNLWALSEKGGLFHRAKRQPIQLTSGPLDFYLPMPSPDGKKVYAIGVQLRAELTRYDSKARQFQPYLSSLWAEQLDFSRDGNWVAYVLYPEGTLWRSRLDGSERLQLTLPPVVVSATQWSPDGKRIAFLASTPGKPQKVFAVPAEGGVAEQLTAGETSDFAPSWSTDGKSIIYGQNPIWMAGKFGTMGIRVLDLKTRQVSTLPGSEGLWHPSLSRDGRYIAAVTSDQQGIVLYNNGTRKWDELTKGAVNCLAWSHDSQYLYFDNYPNRDTAIFRVRISDHKTERVLSLGDLRRAESAHLTAPWMGLAPDDSLLLLRDTGTQEIYAFDVDFP